jgi:NitT/TauT family transport system substrate-binding protein
MKTCLRLAAAAGAALVMSCFAQAAISQERLVVGFPLTPLSVQFAYFAFGEELGFFKEENLKLEYSLVNGTAVLLPQIASGQVHLGIANPDLTLVAAAKGEPLPITFVMNWLRSHGYEFVVADKSPIKELADLKGKKLGVGGLTWGNIPMSRAMLNDLGIAWSKDVEVLPVGIGPAAWRRLDTGEVDALNLFVSQHAAMEQSGIKIRRLTLPEKYRVIFSNGWAGSNTFVEKNPQLIAGFGRALSKSWVACKTNVEACVRAHWRRYPAEAPAVGKEAEQIATDVKRAMFDARMIDDFEPGSNGQFGHYTKDLWVRYVEVMHGAGQLALPNVDVDKLFTNRFVPEFNRFDRAAVEAKAKTVN